MKAKRYYRHRRLCLDTSQPFTSWLAMHASSLKLNSMAFKCVWFLLRSWLNTVDVVSVEKKNKQTDSSTMRTQLQTENGYLIY